MGECNDNEPNNSIGGGGKGVDSANPHSKMHLGPRPAGLEFKNMEVDPLDAANTAAEDTTLRDHRAARLSSWVAITVALLATFLGVCKVKDDNVVQAMQQAQADKLDHWNFYQARNIRQEVAATAVDQLKLATASAPLDQQDRYRAAIATYEALVADQAKKKEE